MNIKNPGLSILIACLYACGPAGDSRPAVFSTLDTHSQTEVLQDEALEAGGAKWVPRKTVQSKAVGYDVLDGNRLKLTFENADGTIKIVPGALGLPVNWMGFGEIRADVENTSKQDIRFDIVLWCPRGRMPMHMQIDAGGRNTLTHSLYDLPLIGLPRVKYNMNEIEIGVQADNYPVTVVVKSLALAGSEMDYPPPVVDRFGQRIRGRWGGKVTEERQLTVDLDLERNRLSDYFGEARFDRYGGWKSGGKWQATGFFRVEEVEVNSGTSRWFFVTPDGHLFWSLGITGIRPKVFPADVTLVKGFEYLFEELPARDGPYGSAYIDSTFSFYNWNILRKYGDLDPWRDMVMKRLQAWGMNTVGNWSEKELVQKSTLPFTWSFRSGFGQWQHDVYDPDWAAYVDEVLNEAAEFRDNPLLLGYFVDNESGWGRLDLLKRLPEDAYLRQEWGKYLQNTYGKVAQYAVHTEQRFDSWEQVYNAPDEIGLPKNDVLVLEEMYARKYFEVITTTLKKYDPNHLYLGCRFTRALKPEHLLKVAGEYCDVLTVNVYAYEPVEEQMDAWHAMTGRPILIGEHHVALDSERQLPLRWQVFSTQERYEYYANYVRTWAEMSYSLGCHWYQWADQNLTGRASNGENQIVGFVDITDQPYDTLVRAVRDVSDKVYRWHAGTSKDQQGGG